METEGVCFVRGVCQGGAQWRGEKFWGQTASGMAAWVGTGVFPMRIGKYNSRKEADEHASHWWASQVDSWMRRGSAEGFPEDTLIWLSNQTSGCRRLVKQFSDFCFAGFEHKCQTMVIWDVVSKSQTCYEYLVGHQHVQSRWLWTFRILLGIMEF